jgi:hypothetical protein
MPGEAISRSTTVPASPSSSFIAASALRSAVIRLSMPSTWSPIINGGIASAAGLPGCTSATTTLLFSVPSRKPTPTNSPFSRSVSSRNWFGVR